MELKDILAISGQPGLYKFIAQSRNGIIVESLTDGTRSNVPSHARVSSLGETAIFTDGEDLPLARVFEAFFTHTDGQATIPAKSAPRELQTLFAQVIPDYDRERVHQSDIKKVIAWYNLLVGIGMTTFKTVEESEKETKE